MSRWLKLIWFVENTWTTKHAAIGINAVKTLCGILRSTRAILPSEKDWHTVSHYLQCGKCRRVLKAKYGHADIVTVKVD